MDERSPAGVGGDGRIAIEILLSLPLAAAAGFRRIEPRRAPRAFVASDPPGRQLGSCGGTAHLLAAAWNAARTATRAPGCAFDEWLRESRKLIVHGSGESRRLPAYAAAGKLLLPLPLLPGMPPQPPDLTLLDLQLANYERLFRPAPDAYRVMVTCGDSLVRHTRWPPRYPAADILIVGLAASASEAAQHGVMICPAEAPQRLLYFLQKPTPDRLRAIGPSQVFSLDTGVWLLSERAVATLMRKCGWDAAGGAFRSGATVPCELYAGVGPALGEDPTQPDPEISGLTCAVLPLTDGRFYHFGTSRSLVASVAQLQRPAAEQRSFGHASLQPDSPPVILNSRVHCRLGPANAHIWIERSSLPAGWELTERHILTGVPPNDWRIRLPPGVCLDFAWVGGGLVCLRPYGFDDAFRGRLADDGARFLGRPLAAWLRARGITWAEAGLDPAADLYEAPLFPVLPPDDLTADWVEWLVAEAPPASAGFRQRWLRALRRSCRDLLSESDLARAAADRVEFRRASPPDLAPPGRPEPAGRLDLAETATLALAENWTPPARPAAAQADGIRRAHESMFFAALARPRDAAEAARLEADAFATLRRLMAEPAEAARVLPTRNVLDDQIVWGRAPVRLDLAGGWTDTPPYCLENGGQVVNLAADLNGQPPIQVFGRLIAEPVVLLHSIDLGLTERVTGYAELTRYGELGSGFGIAKAALALAGLEPRFHLRGGESTLAKQLAGELGGGLELNMLAAVPKGSGLGTSSILAATLLGTLSAMLGLRWTPNDLVLRTLVLEQLLTSGGGWQDQAGGITHGLKLIETAAGLGQQPVFRWLPPEFFGPGFANRQVLLYYTGITRVAHDILAEIVRGLFLNSARHVGLIEEIGQNALFTADALQRGDWDGLCEAVRRSWFLNQRLDGGTNPPEVQAILAPIAADTAACKLLGAGGGGYLLILARDPAAGERIRAALLRRPPNARARFVNLSVSPTGLQVTRS